MLLSHASRPEMIEAGEEFESHSFLDHFVTSMEETPFFAHYLQQNCTHPSPKAMKGDLESAGVSP